MGAIQSPPVLVWRADSEGCFTEANEAWLRFTGRTLEQTLGTGWYDDIHPDDLPHLLDSYREATAHQQPFSVECRLHHFNRIYYRVLFTGLPQPQGTYLGSVVEIAALPVRPLSEQPALPPFPQITDEQFRYALDAMQALLYNWERQTDAIHRSGGLRQIIGYDPDEIPSDGFWWVSRIHPEDRSITDQKFIDSVAVQASSITNEYRIQHKDGHYVWVRDYCRVFYDDAGQPARMIGCTINIDARKRAEDALVQSQQIVQAQLAELEGIYQNAAIGLCILDRDLRYIRINERLAEMNGLPASAHIGRTIHEIVPDLAPVAEPILREILATGKSILNYELHGETAAQPGRQRIWLESWLPIHTLQGEVIGVNVVTEEITDRKQIERRTTSLLELAAALSVALTPVEAAQAILQEGGQGLGATGGSVVILLEDGKTLELLGSFGYPIPTQQHWRQFPLDLPTAPLAVAVKTRKPLWFGSLEERLAQIPFTPNAPIDSAHQAWASLPLLVNDQVVGGLGLSFPTPQGFEQAERDFMMTLAHLCAQALERARLHQQAKQLAAYEERQRLARELHDSVSQVLFSSSIMAETLPQVWARDPQRAMERLTEIVTYNRAAMAEMRTLLLELRPESIVRTPLRELLEQQVRVVQGRKTLDIQLHIDGAESPAVPEVHVALYRITQESLNNVVKHSHASRVRVELQTSPSRVRLHISDDGRGFDLKRTTAGIGLNSIRERAQMIGAVLRLHSAVGQGTQLTLEWSASNN